MKCNECPYFWIEEYPWGDEPGQCMYRWNDGYAPCEVDDRERETEDD